MDGSGLLNFRTGGWGAGEKKSLGLDDVGGGVVCGVKYEFLAVVVVVKQMKRKQFGLMI